MPLISRRHYPLLFAALAVMLLLTEWFVVQSRTFRLRPDTLSLGVTVDVVLVLPLLYYWFIVRTGHWSKTSMVAVVGASVAVAKWLLPAKNQTYMNGIARVLPLLELGVLGYVGWHGVAVLQVYRIYRQNNPDFVLNLQQSLADVTGKPKLSHLIAGEAAVFRYGLLGWWTTPSSGAGQQVFTSHRQSAQVAFLVAIMFICGIEMAALHLLVARWSVAGSWLLTAVSLYSLLFIIAETVATVQQPTLFDGQTLHLRFGLRWRVGVSRNNIERIERINEAPPKQADFLTGPLLVPPNVLLILRKPVLAKGMYGITKTVKQVALLVDEPDEFATLAG